MPFCHQPIITWSGAAEACFITAEDPGDWILAEAAAAYRPRHPERSGFYQLFETHFDSYVRAYEERFETGSGPLLPVVVRSVEAFLDCGRLQGGFARIRCPKCCDEHLLAFSRRTTRRSRRLDIAEVPGPLHHASRPGHGRTAKLDDGNLAMETPPDPRIGATLLALDPLEWIHRITATSPMLGAIANAFTAPTITGPESAPRQPLAAAPLARQTDTRSRTIPTLPRKPGACGRAC